MDFVIAIGSASRFQEVHAALPHDYPYEVRSGSVAATSAGCDAEFVSFPIACERYGADPTKHVAQVQINERGDGAPEVIVAIPPLEVDAHGKPISMGMGYREWVSWAIGASAGSLAISLGRLAGVSVLLHLEAAGMDERPLDVLDVVREIGSHPDS